MFWLYSVVLHEACTGLKVLPQNNDEIVCFGCIVLYYMLTSETRPTIYPSIGLAGISC